MSEHLDPTLWRTVLLAGQTDETEADMLDLAIDAGIEHRILPDLGRRMNPLRDLRAFAEILSIIRHLRPDVVCTHTAKAGALGRVAAFVHRVPARVHTFHGHVFHGYFSGLATRAIVWTERLLGRLTSRILAVSEEVARDLVETHRIAPADRVQVVRLGLDLSEFIEDRPRGAFRESQGISPTAPLLVAVGRLVPIKDHALLLESVAILARERPEVRLAIVGDGPCRDTLVARARRDDLRGHVIFTGWQRDLPPILTDMDVAVLTSLNEGTPVALIEGAAAGRPAVATNVGGVREVVEDGVTGHLVPHGDPVAFADACGRLLDDEALRTRMGAAAREHVRTAFSTERLCREVEALYDACIKERRIQVPPSC
jgi:glycosyltransferase involved in cell wall biosynthesis